MERFSTLESRSTRVCPTELVCVVMISIMASCCFFFVSATSVANVPMEL